MVAIFKTTFDTYHQAISGDMFIGFFHAVTDFEPPINEIGLYSYMEVRVGNEDKIRIGKLRVDPNDKVRFGHGWGSYSDGTIIKMENDVLTIQTEYDIVENIKIEAVYQIL